MFKKIFKKEKKENSDNKKTYLGVTVNMKRRLRQHNGELVGGAKYTTSNKGIGEWILKATVPNLTKLEALSFERTIKRAVFGTVL